MNDGICGYLPCSKSLAAMKSTAKFHSAACKEAHRREVLREAPVPGGHVMFRVAYARIRRPMRAKTRARRDQAARRLATV